MNTRDLAAVGSLVGGAIALIVGVALLAPAGYAVLTAGVLLLVAGVVLAWNDGPGDTGPPGEEQSADAPIDTRRGWPIGSRKA